MNDITRLPTYNIPKNLSLGECAEVIKQVHETAIFIIGEVLLQVKDQLPHGEFMPWVQKNCPFAMTQANNYMRVTKRKDEFIEPPTNLKQAVTELREKDQINTRVLISEQPKILRHAPETAVDREIRKLSNEAIRKWDQRSKVMVMLIKEFLTKEEPVGRDLLEAVTNIRNFDSWEDINQLRAMKIQCEELAKRAAIMATQIEDALVLKEKLL